VSTEELTVRTERIVRVAAGHERSHLVTESLDGVVDRAEDARTHLGIERAVQLVGALLVDPRGNANGACRSNSSHWRVAKKLSATALSSASPTVPIEPISPAVRRRWPHTQEQYWDPWSECAVVAVGRRRIVAMSMASTTSSARKWSAIDQPTTRRHQASITTAR